jgi:fructose-bisphosphate aldolase class 1
MEETVEIILNNKLYEPLAAEFQYEQVRILKQVLKKFEITGDKARQERTTEKYASPTRQKQRPKTTAVLPNR